MTVVRQDASGGPRDAKAGNVGSARSAAEPDMDVVVVARRMAALKADAPAGDAGPSQPFSPISRSRSFRNPSAVVPGFSTTSGRGCRNIGEEKRARVLP